MSRALLAQPRLVIHPFETGVDMPKDTAPARVAPTLADCEQTIERGMATFVEVGAALLAIRDGNLYRDSHETFELYCRDRWGWGRNYANKMIGATEIVGALGTAVPKPTSERQARALAPLKAEPKKMDRAWQKAHAATGGKPTAADVTAQVEKIAPPPAPPAPPAGSPRRAPLAERVENLRAALGAVAAFDPEKAAAMAGTGAEWARYATWLARMAKATAPSYVRGGAVRSGRDDVTPNFKK